jgi:phenylacetate-CoA ligase
MGFFQRVAILECDPVEAVEKRNRKAWLMDPLLKIRVFSLFQDHKALVKQLADFAPQNIYAYPSHLLELGQCMQRNDMALPSVQRLFTSSEFLEAGARDYICERFQADLFDHYGCTELKEVAWECSEHGDYHLNADEIMLEIVDGDRQCELGEPGEVVLTDLRNKGMAFIRYQINDYGVKTAGSCACGFVGESFRPLGGRASDNLQLPDGSELSPYSLTTAVEHTPGLIQYQLEQTKPSELLIHALWREAPAEDVIAELTKTIASIVGAGVDVQVRSVEQLDIEENGKFKVVKRSF